MYDPCACPRYKGLRNSVGDSFLLNCGLKWTLQFLAKRAHKNLWERCLWGCWSLAKNRKKAECWLINIHNYRNFLQINAHVRSFSHHNGHCFFPVIKMKKIMWITLKREKLWLHLEISYTEVTYHTISGWCPPTQSSYSSQIWRQTPGSLRIQIHWFLIVSVKGAPFQASSCSKIFQLVEINPIEVPLGTNQMRLDCNWGKL